MWSSASVVKNLGNCPCTGEGDPINAGTGNKFQAESDFTAAPSTGLSLTRYYNSQDTTASPFGKNWHSTWHRGLSVNGSVVTVTRADGRQDNFTNNGAGIYTADPDVMDRLIRVPATGTQTGWQLIKADNSVETYTPTGLLTTITTRAGLVTSLAYDGNNNLIRVTGPFGHTLTFAYDGSGRVNQMTVPDGGIYGYAYSSVGNLASVTYPSGAQRQYVYENTSFPNVLTGIIDENGQRFATWTYDTQGRATSSQHAGSADLTTIAYNSDGTTSVTDARGNLHGYSLVTQFGVVKPASLTGAPVQSAGGQAFTYDSNGFIASRTDWDGNVTTYTHDARGDETSRVEADGTAVARTITTTWHATFHLPLQIVEPSRTTTFTYDAKGNLLTRTATAQGVSRRWSYTYNSAGQVLTATDPRGVVTTYAYDASGNLARAANALGQVTLLSSYDADGRPLTIQDPNGLVTTLTYNFRGQVTSKTEAQWTTTYTYDAAGQLTRLTRPDRSFLVFTYDPAHRLTGITDSLGNRTVYTLDAASNRIKAQVFAASGALTRTQSYSYDAVNRLTQAIGALGQTTSYAYDTNGNLTQVIDPLNQATGEFYDALNRLVATVDPLSGQTNFAYDSMNRPTGVMDPRGLVTSYAYDGLDDVTAIASPDTGVTAKTYDGAGNVNTSTDARGTTAKYTYDALNRVIKTTYADGTALVYQYDRGVNGIGRMTSMSDPSGATTWTYNVHGQVISKQQTTGAVTLTTSRAYNATTGQLASIAYPSGATISYSYDANGRVSAISSQPSGGANTSLVSQATYQPFGLAASWRQGNGASYSRTFDQDGRIAALALPASAIALAYDAASRITSMTETGVPAASYGYDALNRLTSYKSGTVTQTYSYDASGNRTANTSNGTTPFSFTYTNDTASNRLRSIGGTFNGTTWNESFAYDANGNTDSYSAPFADYSFSYDARNRLTESFVGALGTTYRINGLGQRVSGPGLIFVYDESGHQIGKYDGTGKLLWETVWLGNLPVAVLQTGGAFYIAPDHLGAPHQITNAGSQVVWQWNHDPFGNGAPTGSLAYDLRFPGQFFDQNTGLHYNYFRDYDPRLGRYIESDPIGLASGVNTYAYVGGNAIMRIDPLGLLNLNLFPPTSDIGQIENSDNPPNVYSVGAHGTPSFIFDQNRNRLSPSQLAQIIMNDTAFTPGEIVELHSCNTGAGSNSFAQQLSNILNTPVLAPDNFYSIQGTKSESNNRLISWLFGPTFTFTGSTVGPTKTSNSGHLVRFTPFVSNQ